MMRSLFYSDMREHKAAARRALENYRVHGQEDRAIGELREAVSAYRIKHDQLLHQVRKLMIANNVDRAIKLVNVLCDDEPRIIWLLARIAWLLLLATIASVSLDVIWRMVG